jgi:hypothetical protein
MIHFITPLYRYNNIKITYSTIINQTSDFIWHLIEGSNKIGEDSLDFLKNDHRVSRYKIDTNYIYGHEQRNYFITNINGNNDDWCYFLDDDNVITQDLIDVANEFKDSNYDVILLSQKQGLTEKQRLYGYKGNFKLGNCDIGSFLIRYSAIKKTLIPSVSERNSDGHYAEQIASLPNINILYKPEKFTRYNSLSLEIY